MSRSRKFVKENKGMALIRGAMFAVAKSCLGFQNSSDRGVYYIVAVRWIWPYFGCGIWRLILDAEYGALFWMRNTAGARKSVR